MAIITRVTKTNRANIIDDARAGFPDDTAFDLTSDGQLIVNGATPFAGEYRIVRVKGPRWLGDNGYTFERDLNDCDTLVMNAPYVTSDRTYRTMTDARVAHFTQLVEQYHLDDDLLAAARGSIEAATSVDEVRSLASLVQYLTAGYAVAAFTGTYEAALAKWLIAEAPAFAYRCQYCGEVYQTDAEIDSVFCPVARHLVEAVCVKRPAVQPPTEHAQRQRVIDRALDTNRKYTDDQVAQYPLLREIALDFVRAYRGTNTYVQDIAIRLADYGTLSVPQMRGALNVMVAEARIARAQRAIEIADMNVSNYDEPPYMDLRRKEDKQIADVGDALPSVDEAANDVAPALPNGTYTVLLDPDGKTYRTLRVKDCPAHFTVKPGTQLVEYLSGSDNTNDYTGFAFLTGRKAAVWKRYRTAGDLGKAIELLVADPMTAAAEYVKRSNRCFVCNRRLTTPESIARGIGPICVEKIGELGYTFHIGGDPLAAAKANVDGSILGQLIDARIRRRQSIKERVDAELDRSLENVAVDQSDYEARGDQPIISREVARKSCENCLGDGEVPDDDLAYKLGAKGAFYVPCPECRPIAYKRAIERYNAQAAINELFPD